MNVNVCYDRYGKKSSLDSGSTNKSPRTNPQTTPKNQNNNENNNEKRVICDTLRTSPIKGPSVRSKSDLNISTLKHLKRGTSYNEMAVNKLKSNNGTKTRLNGSSNNISSVPSRLKANTRSKSDLWNVKRSCKPAMATVVETAVTSNSFHSQNDKSSHDKTNTNNSDNSDFKLSPRNSKLNNDLKPSRIPVSPSFQRKLNANRATNNDSPHQHKSKLPLTSRNKVFDKPINRTQSSYVIQSKANPKQSSYGQNKERS